MAVIKVTPEEVLRERERGDLSMVDARRRATSRRIVEELDEIHAAATHPHAGDNCPHAARLAELLKWMMLHKRDWL